MVVSNYPVLSQRILSRRLPQAARYTLPRASFSQLRALRAEAEESENPFPVLRLPIECWSAIDTMTGWQLPEPAP
jgi:hypothetical protein